MPTVVFKGRNRLNEIIAGERDAATQDELRALLRREQVVLTQATEKGREIAIPKLGRRKKVGAKELAVFTRQFSVMIDAGLPLVQCIDILGEQQQNAFFKDVLRQVRQNVEEGATLYQAMERHQLCGRRRHLRGHRGGHEHPQSLWKAGLDQFCLIQGMRPEALTVSAASLPRKEGYFRAGREGA